MCTRRSFVGTSTCYCGTTWPTGSFPIIDIGLTFLSCGSLLTLLVLISMQFYGDTVKQMALRQLVPGSPLRTLCLLVAGQPAEVFSTGSTGDLSFPGSPQQQAQVIHIPRI